MKPRNTLILLAAAVLLGAFVYKFERGEKPDKTADRSVVQLAGFKKPEEVMEITITRPTGALTLQRVPKPEPAKKADDATGPGEDDWRLLVPVQGGADKNEANAWVRTLLSAKATASYGEEKAKELGDSDTGLNQPVATISLKNAAGQEGKLAFGAPNLSGDAVWARANNAGAYLQFSKIFVDESLVKQDVGKLRDKTLLAVAAPDVQTVNLAYPNGSIKLARDSASAWQLDLGTKKLPADRDAVDNLLASLINTKIETFIDPAGKSVVSYGLEKPRVKVTLGAGAKGEFELAVGDSSMEATTPEPSNPSAPPPPQEKVYVQRKGDKEVLQLPGSLYAALLKTPQDFRDKTILAFDPLTVSKIAYNVGDKRVELEKTKGTGEVAAWQLIKPAALTADDKRVGQLLEALHSLLAKDFIDEPAGLAQYGLDKPLTTIELSEGETKLPVLQIGKSSSEGAGSYFKRSDSPVVYVANSNLLGPLETNVNRLRDLGLVKIDRTLVKSIEMQATGRDTVKLVSKGAEDWQTVTTPTAAAGQPAPKPGEPKEADSGRVAGLLTDLSDLRGDEWVTDQPTDLAKYGLAKPEVTCTVTLNNGDKKVILVGRDPKAGSLAAFAKVEGSNVIVRNDDGSLIFRLARSASEFEPVPEMPMGGMPMGMPPG